MRRIFLFFLIIFLIVSCKKKNKEQMVFKQPMDSIRVYAVKIYENSTFWNRIADIYKNDYNTKVIYKFFDTLPSVLDSLSNADVVLGIDKTYYALLEKDTTFISYRPVNYQFIKRTFKPKDNLRLIPYAYNYNVFYYKDRLKDYPKTLGVLQDQDLENSIILYNPKTTYLGRDFILNSLAIYNNLGYRRFWRGIKKNVQILSNDFKDGVDKFINSDNTVIIYFPLVNPYLKHFKYFIPKEGYYCTVFYMGIPNTAKNQGKSKRFIDFILFDEVQKEIFDSDYAIPISTKVIETIANRIDVNKQGKNFCNKPKPGIIRANIKYMNAIWKRTFKKFRKKKK